MAVSPVPCCSPGQFAAFLNAKPKERAELLEELTGTEIYGQISADVFEKHKVAKIELEKPRRRPKASCYRCAAESLNASVQALTDEEQRLSDGQRRAQAQLNWLIRSGELQTAPDQAKKPWQRHSRHVPPPNHNWRGLHGCKPPCYCGLSGNGCGSNAKHGRRRRQNEEVNTRLQASLALRAQIRASAAHQHQALMASQNALPLA
jgi:exonuclease SbcC